MHTSSGRFALLAGVLLACGSGQYASAQEPAPPTAEFLCAALRYQETASVRAAYVVRDSPDAARAWEYRRTAQAVLLKDVVGGVVASYDAETGECRTQVIDSTDKEKRAVLIATSLSGPFCDQSLLETARYPLFAGAPGTRTLREWLPQGTVSDHKEQIDGHECWRVTVPGPTRSFDAYVIWLDPGIGFCPRRIDFTPSPAAFAGKVKSMEARFGDYRDLGDGVWFPARLEYESRLADGAVQLRVAEASSVGSEPAGPKADLLVPIPSGTDVQLVCRDGIVRSRAE